MKLIFSGSSFCNLATLKRLLIICEELHFIDHPSVSFGNWGTVGYKSESRRVDWSGSSVPILPHEAPSGPLKSLFIPYIERDLNNYDFIETFFYGFKEDNFFASKFIDLSADYQGITGHEIRDAIISDKSLLRVPDDLSINVPPLLSVSNSDNRVNTFKVLLYSASVEVTNSLIIAENTKTIPITDDRYFAKLFALRSSSENYMGVTSKITPFLGL